MDPEGCGALAVLPACPICAARRRRPGRLTRRTWTNGHCPARRYHLRIGQHRVDDLRRVSVSAATPESRMELGLDSRA